MINEVIRTLNGVYYAPNNTISFTKNPYLIPGNKLTLFFNDNDARFSCSVNSISANNATVSFIDSNYDSRSLIAQTPNFASGITGPQDTFTFKLSTPPNLIVQAISTGGNNSLNLEASTDQAHWITLATLNLTEANSNTAFVNITSPWPYGRINVASIATNNSIAVNLAI